MRAQTPRTALKHWNETTIPILGQRLIQLNIFAVIVCRIKFGEIAAEWDPFNPRIAPQEETSGRTLCADEKIPRRGTGIIQKIYRVGQKEVHRDYRLVRLNGTCQIYDFFLHKGSTEGGKQMPVNLVQGDVKYQGKYVLCRDMHFGHIIAGN